MPPFPAAHSGAIGLIVGPLSYVKRVIVTKHLMTRALNQRIPHLALAALSAAALAGCAGGSDRYPSFALPQPVKDEAVIEPQQALVLPAALPEGDELDRRLTDLQSAAAAAHGDFTAKAGQARSQLSRGRTRVEATLILADLTTYQSEVRLALADIDELAANAAIGLADPAQAAPITAAQIKVANLLAEQSEMLATLNDELENR